MPRSVLRPPVLRLTALAVALSSGAAACSSSSGGVRSSSGSTSAAVRTIAITMVDIGYQPNTPINLPKGSAIRFDFHNTGKLTHEAIIGDDTAQATHDTEMAKGSTMPGTQMGGGMGGTQTNGDEVNVEPGKSASLTYTFTQAGSFVIGCHYPGHYAAGMKIPVTVS